VGPIATVLAFGVLLPAAVAGVVVAVLGSVRPMRPGPAAALALGVAYVSGHLGIAGWHGLTPVDVTHRLPLLAVLAGALGLVAWGAPHPLRRVAPALAAPVAAWALVAPRFVLLDTTATFAIAGGATLALVLLCAVWSRATRAVPSIVSALALVLTATALALASAASGSLVVGQLAGAIAAATAAIGLVAVLMRRDLALDTLAATAGILLGSVALVAVAYSTTPPLALLPWALMPAAPWLLHATLTHRMRRAPALAIHALALTLLGAATLGWAYVATSPGPTADEASPYDYAY
jgi:hypothetical protein